MIAEYDIAEKMAKLMLYVFVALLAATLIMGAPDKSQCGRHGDPVSICILAYFIFLIKLLFLSFSFFKNTLRSTRKMRKVLELA